MVETLGRSDANGASRAGRHRKGLGQECSNSEPEDGVRVPSAEFHESEGLFQVLPDLCDQSTGQMGISKFINIFHRTATSNNILTAEVLRTQRSHFLFGVERPPNKKVFARFEILVGQGPESLWRIGLSPILHKNILLRVLCASAVKSLLASRIGLLCKGGHLFEQFQ
jgi:hypothetical protein